MIEEVDCVLPYCPVWPFRYCLQSPTIGLICFAQRLTRGLNATTDIASWWRASKPPTGKTMNSRLKWIIKMQRFLNFSYIGWHPCVGPSLSSFIIITIYHCNRYYHDYCFQIIIPIIIIIVIISLSLLSSLLLLLISSKSSLFVFTIIIIIINIIIIKTYYYNFVSSLSFLSFVNGIGQNTHVNDSCSMHFSGTFYSFFYDNSKYTSYGPWCDIAMMTSSNGNIFRYTGHLCGEFTVPRWIPHTKVSDAELWCFPWSASE